MKYFGNDICRLLHYLYHLENTWKTIFPVYASNSHKTDRFDSHIFIEFVSNLRTCIIFFFGNLYYIYQLLTTSFHIFIAKLFHKNESNEITSNFHVMLWKCCHKAEKLFQTCTCQNFILATFHNQLSRLLSVKIWILPANKKDNGICLRVSLKANFGVVICA